MESDEVAAALNHLRFRAFIMKNNISFKDHRSDEDEEKELLEILYLDEEIMCRPRVDSSSSDSIQIGDSLLTYQHRRKGTRLEMSFGLSKLAIADVLVTAVNIKDTSKLIVLSKDVTEGGIVRCNHPQVCQAGNGFMDGTGTVTIRLQIQARPNKPAIHSFHRHFRLQLYWFRKKKIDKVFSEVMKSTLTTYNKCKNDASGGSEWERYLVEASEDFSLNKDLLWQGLLDRFKGDYFLVDIVNSGSKRLLDKKPPQLIEASKDDFHLIGRFGDLLSHTLKLAYLTIHQLDVENLTVEHVKEFEERLLENGSFVFQSFFINSKLKQSFQRYQEQTNLKMDDEVKTNISVDDGKGGNFIEEQPDDTDYSDSKPSDTTQNELDESLRAITTMYKKCLDPVKVAGAKFRENMKNIHAKYSVGDSRELEKLISQWHVTAQEDAYDQFREQEEKIKDADYIADKGRRKFVSRSTAAEKKAIKSQDEARLIGEMGEKHAYKYFTAKYEGLGVRWMNEHQEAGHPYDLCIYDKNKQNIFIEVKSTCVLGKNWFYLTPNEYEYAREHKEKYIIAHVHINENEQDETKKYTLTEYVNPLKDDSELKLSMTHWHKE